MPEECTHADAIRDVTPSALGCEECLKTGSPWVHLRLCRTCGHVGCCDDSPLGSRSISVDAGAVSAPKRCLQAANSSW